MARTYVKRVDKNEKSLLWVSNWLSHGGKSGSHWKKKIWPENDNISNSPSPDALLGPEVGLG